MPPVLDPDKSKVDGLAFLGLSLSRHHPDVGHPDSVTHQTAFDLNEVLDREYEYIFSTNDDGWLVGGGERGPPHSYKLASKDSAHVEIMRIGTYKPEWGGVSQQEIVNAMKSGTILIPQILVVPTSVVANPDAPPELEIRFDMEKFDNFFAKNDEASGAPLPPLPINWGLRFLHNQLFKHFKFPSRFCPGAFHSTILRKAEFRSDEHRKGYFDKCDKAIAKWKQAGPQPLHAVDMIVNPKDSNENSNDSDEKVDDDHHHDEKKMEEPLPCEYKSGIYLFTDRENITHFFEPNFLPPYDTPEKRKIIFDVLKEEWDQETLSWKPFPAPPPPPTDSDDKEQKGKAEDENGIKVEKAAENDTSLNDDRKSTTKTPTTKVDNEGMSSIGMCTTNTENCALM